MTLAWAAAVLTIGMYSSDDLKYLSEAIYFEARSEPVECQEIVAQVILNRVEQKRFPNTIKEVVHYKKRNTRGNWVCQFSYYCDGKSDVMRNIDAEIRSYQVASKVLLRKTPDLSKGADHYYAHNLVYPYWGPKLKETYQCANHTFGKLKW